MNTSNTRHLPLFPVSTTSADKLLAGNRRTRLVPVLLRKRFVCDKAKRSIENDPGLYQADRFMNVAESEQE